MAFSAADKQRVEDLTGCIPLLLHPFLMHSGKSFQSLEPLIWDDEALASVGRDIIDFARKQRSNLLVQQREYASFPFPVNMLLDDDSFSL